jgi:hypothetical protein
MRDDQHSTATTTRGIVRPREHIENVRRAAAAAISPDDGDDGAVVLDTFAWLLGERRQAPLTKTRSAGTAPSPQELAAELDAAREAGPVSPRNPMGIIGHLVREVLEWALGIDDQPPVYGLPRPTAQPGDLVGGRGSIVRSTVTMLAVLSAARTGREHADEQDAAQAAGVIAVLEFALGRRQTSPIEGRYFIDLPEIADMDGGAAEDVWHGQGPYTDQRPPAFGQGPVTQYSPEYGLGVLQTIDWLTGSTTKPPVDRDGQVRQDGQHGPDNNDY